MYTVTEVIDSRTAPVVEDLDPLFRPEPIEIMPVVRGLGRLAGIGTLIAAGAYTFGNVLPSLVERSTEIFTRFSNLPATAIAVGTAVGWGTWELARKVTGIGPSPKPQEAFTN